MPSAPMLGAEPTDPTRPTAARTPWWRGRTAAAAAAGALLIVVVCLFGSTFQQYLLGLVLIYGMSALGLDWLMGRAGQVSIGNGALMAVGGFLTAGLSRLDWVVFPVPVIASGVVGAVVGLIIALPSLRLSGVYFALVTLALQFLVVFGAQWFEATTGEVSGLPVRAPSIGGVTFEYGPSYLVLLAAVLGVAMLLLRNMYRRMPGRMWLAIRESELAASTIQVDARRWKLSAFVGSSSLIAVSGSLLAYYMGTVSSDTFTLDFAITFVVMIIVGGMGSMGGALLGAAVVTLAPFGLRTLAQLDPDSLWLQTNLPVVQNGLYGFIVLLVLLYLPRGVVPTLAGLLTKASRQRATAAVDLAAVHTAPALTRDRAEPDKPETGLVISDLQVTYRNGARALNGAGMTVGAGEVVAVVGRNGAGKSTLLRSISGFFGTEQVSSAGSVRFAGTELVGATPLRTSRLGVVLVPERDKVFPSLTVADHISHLGAVDAARAAIPDAWPILERRWRSPAGLLSGGERQLLAIAMAASLEPELLLLDEMSLGLAPVMIDRVADAIRQLRAARPITIVIVEQNIAVASALAERVYRLDGGRLGPLDAHGATARGEVAR
jgi:branched-chain amino acid transport system permease protein